MVPTNACHMDRRIQFTAHRCISRQHAPDGSHLSILSVDAYSTVLLLIIAFSNFSWINDRPDLLPVRNDSVGAIQYLVAAEQI